LLPTVENSDGSSVGVREGTTLKVIPFPLCD
jgi:hypothetical protein